AGKQCRLLATCIEQLTGPDGVTDADVPHGRLREGRFLYELADLDPKHPGLESRYRCLVNGVTDANGALVTTQLPGRCVGGPNADGQCQSSLDCGTEQPPRYLCLGGDEYDCEVDELVGSNDDGEPPCAGPCLSAEILGAPGSGCGLGGKAIC